MTNPDYTHLAFIADRSGSMMSIASDMNGAIAQVLKDQAVQPGELHVDIWTFDDRVEHPYRDARADDVKGVIIQPRGSTALNDAVIRCVTELGARFAAMDENDRPGKVIVALVTDGLENSSKENPGVAGRDLAKSLVERQQSKFSWEFLFFGATSMGDVMAASAGYGIRPDSTLAYHPSAAGVAGYAAAATRSMSSTRLGESAAFTEEERLAAAGSEEN